MTVGTPAASAVEHSPPLLVLPGGTLNHFVRDTGTGSLREAVAAATKDEHFARPRLLWSVLTGTVATSRITHLREATEVHIESAGSPLALAVDGEALAGVRSARFRVEPRALTYYSPRP